MFIEFFFILYRMNKKPAGSDTRVCGHFNNLSEQI